MHNYTSKILAQLINKGLAESRAFVEDGKKMSYFEYRLIQPASPVKPSQQPDTQSHTERPNRPKKIRGGMPESETPRAPHIYVEQNRKCVECPAYYRAADDGKKCTIDCGG
ncbi:unnamed protein product [marine sediment metagenome]|uniref:Uncharacterized protein n=1 Tax=marine sediment metagenome TaxID=412755 RepID=X0VXD3_9ZZZZ